MVIFYMFRVVLLHNGLYLHLGMLIFDAVRISNVELKRKLHDLAIKESVPTSLSLEKLKWQPKQKGRLFIPLCRMLPLPVVRPFLKNDVSQFNSFYVGWLHGGVWFFLCCARRQPWAHQ